MQNRLVATFEGVLETISDVRVELRNPKISQHIKATLVKKCQKVKRKGEKGSEKVERAEKGENGIDKMGEG